MTTHLLDGIDTWSTRSLFGLGKPRHIDANESFLLQGEPGGSLIYIVSGAARVTQAGIGGTRVLGDLGSGDIAGEMSLLTGQPRTATVTALSDLEVLEIDRPSLDRLIEHAPAIASRLMLNVARMVCERVLLREASVEMPACEAPRPND